MNRFLYFKWSIDLLSLNNRGHYSEQLSHYFENICHYNGGVFFFPLVWLWASIEFGLQSQNHDLSLTWNPSYLRLWAAAGLEPWEPPQRGAAETDCSWEISAHHPALNTDREDKDYKLPGTILCTCKQFIHVFTWQGWKICSLKVLKPQREKLQHFPSKFIKA